MGLSFSEKLVRYLSTYKVFDAGRYLFCRFMNRPYFGRVHGATQGNPVKHFFISRLTTKALHDRSGEQPFRILEIGSWAGGSALTFASAAKGSRHEVGIFCVDQWRPYFDLSTHKGDTYRIMERALKEDVIFRLFLHNVRSSGNSDIIYPLRGASDTILPLLKEASFDIVFIDGMHAYSQVVRDLRNSVSLVREGGVLCGDDLDLQLSAVDVPNAKRQGEMDYITDPKTGKFFHPGVTLAVHEVVGEVSCWHGFWAMRRRGGSWENIVLEYGEDEITPPRHLI